MVLNTQKQESYAQSPQTNSFKEWKWEKRHWLLVIALGCLALWWVGSSMLEVSLVQKAVKLLPVIGSACFAAEAVIKLV